MESNKHPTYGNGKICYIELPAIDVQQSAAFYEAVFGWHIRESADGSVSFDDGVGEVSGTWVAGRPAATSGLTVHIMVDDMAATVRAITEHGGLIVQQITTHGSEHMAMFSDPAGNALGLFQQ